MKLTKHLIRPINTIDDCKRAVLFIENASPEDLKDEETREVCEILEALVDYFDLKQPQLFLSKLWKGLTDENKS